MRILVVEDNEGIAGNIFDFLEQQGNEVECVADGYAALGICEPGRFDVIVLDLLIPKLSGVEVCRRLRQERRIATPILMLTALDSVNDKLSGFDAGADDYLTKPFSMREMWARLRALHARSRGTTTAAELSVGALVYDSDARNIRLRGGEIVLPPKCLQILLAMIRQPEKTFSRAEIERIAWGRDEMRHETVRAHMSSLRRALARPDLPVPVQNLHGIGYRLAPDFLAAITPSARK